MKQSCFETKENAFVYSTKKNPRQVEMILQKLEGVDIFGPTVLNDDISCDIISYCGLPLEDKLELKAGQKGFGIAVPFGTDLKKILPSSLKGVFLKDQNGSFDVFKKAKDEEFFVNKKGVYLPKKEPKVKPET